MPNDFELKRRIEANLRSFLSDDLRRNALLLFETLGYESDKRANFTPNTGDGFKAFLKENGVQLHNGVKAHLDEWLTVDFLFQLTDEEISRRKSLFDSSRVDVSETRIESYLFFAVKLKKEQYRRSELAEITREINLAFPMPVMILFQHGNSLTFSIIDRRPHKREESKDVLRKVTLIKDIRLENPHRAHTEILSDLALDNLSVRNFVELHNAWQKKLDVELVTNNFFRDYKKVFERVETEIEKSIADKETARLFNQRLFNRLMFVYFVQKKNWLEFEGSSNYLRSLFNKAEANGENFFRERLYWVFFQGLGANIESEQTHGDQSLIEKRGVVPYLNGGLFEVEKDGWDERGKVALENSLFADILDLFEHYNFTVEESTPLEVQVAIDPEILGRVFEELVTGRHESGSYYTPRQIVSFMCRESLKHYLATLDTAETIAEFVDEGKGENLCEPEQILGALKKIRVCDPACGSGAYLLGMMQELLRLRDALFTSKHLGDASLYNRKREIIENNIYGVDIDRFAVQIASLRLWLSLAIESKEPRALPNLKYKIGCGDSLLAPLENDSQPDLHRRALIEQFRHRKTEYSSASEHIKKSEIDREIKRLRVEIAQSLHHLPEPPKPHEVILAESNIQPLREKIKRLMDSTASDSKSQAEKFQKELNKLLAQIEQWKRQIEIKDYTPDFFDWTVEFAEAFTDGGFDVVLANPPYIRQELLGKKYKEDGLRPNFAEVYSGTADIYVYFFARANAMLKQSGVGCFISSNKWLRAGYGEKLRQLLLDQTKFHLVVDFGDLPVFKATAYPSIFLWQNAERKETPTAWAEVKDLEICYQDGVRQHISEIAHILPAEQFGTGKPRIATMASAGLRGQMESKGQPLKEYVKGEIYYGIKTGLNEAFVINCETRDRLIAEDKRSAEVIKPFLSGNEVRRYEIRFGENYMIFTRRGIVIENYPAVLNYLERYKNRLLPIGKKDENGKSLTRKVGTYKWFEIQDAVDYYKAFESPKIIYPVISTQPRFSFDDNKFYGNDKVFFLAIDDFYLLGVLNSQSVFDWVKQTLSPLRGGFYEFRGIYLETLPIPNASDDEREAIAKLAKETQNRHTERRGKVEQFLGDIGTSAADSTSRNPLEQVWTLTAEEFLKRTKSRFDVSVFQHAKGETAALTEQITRLEREIDERVAELYGVKLES